MFVYISVAMSSGNCGPSDVYIRLWSPGASPSPQATILLQHLKPRLFWSPFSILKLQLK